MLRIKIVVRADASFEFDTDRPDVPLSDVVKELDRWFEEIRKDENVGPQIARLAEERKRLAAAVARQTDSLSSTAEGGD